MEHLENPFQFQQAHPRFGNCSNSCFLLKSSVVSRTVLDSYKIIVLSKSKVSRVSSQADFEPPLPRVDRGDKRRVEGSTPAGE